MQYYLFIYVVTNTCAYIYGVYQLDKLFFHRVICLDAFPVEISFSYKILKDRCFQLIPVILGKPAGDFSKLFLTYDYS